MGVKRPPRPPRNRESLAAATGTIVQNSVTIGNRDPVNQSL